METTRRGRELIWVLGGLKAKPREDRPAPVAGRLVADPLKRLLAKARAADNKIAGTSVEWLESTQSGSRKPSKADA